MSYFEEKWFESSPLATYPEKEEVCRLNSSRSFDLGEIFRHLSEKYRSVKSSPGLPLFHPDSRFLPPCTPYEKFHGPTSELLCIIKTKTWHNKETGYIFLGLLIGPSHGEHKKNTTRHRILHNNNQPRTGFSFPRSSFTASAMGDEGMNQE